MNSSNLKGKELPKTSELKELYQHERYRHTFWRTVKSTVFMLVVVAAFAILIAVLFLPILRIYGDSMKGTLNSGDIVVSVKSNDFESSDVVAFITITIFWSSASSLKLGIGWIWINKEMFMSIIKDWTSHIWQIGIMVIQILSFPIRYRKIESLSWEITGKSPLIRETTLLVQSLMNRLLESWYLRFGHCLNWDGLNK